MRWIFVSGIDRHTANDGERERESHAPKKGVNHLVYITYYISSENLLRSPLDARPIEMHGQMGIYISPVLVHNWNAACLMSARNLFMHKDLWPKFLSFLR